jgi:hypothetical protein
MMTTTSAQHIPSAADLPARPTAGTYKDIWNALKNNTTKTIVVRCNPLHMETLIQAVKKIKSTENAARKRLDDPTVVPHYGRLKVEIDKDKRTVKFSLTYAVGDIV